jgi:hypothetical protein
MVSLDSIPFFVVAIAYFPTASILANSIKNITRSFDSFSMHNLLPLHLALKSFYF